MGGIGQRVRVLGCVGQKIGVQGCVGLGSTGALG